MNADVHVATLLGRSPTLRGNCVPGAKRGSAAGLPYARQLRDMHVAAFATSTRTVVFTMATSEKGRQRCKGHLPSSFAAGTVARDHTLTAPCVGILPVATSVPPRPFRQTRCAWPQPNNHPLSNISKCWSTATMAMVVMIFASAFAVDVASATAPVCNTSVVEPEPRICEKVCTE